MATEEPRLSGETTPFNLFPLSNCLMPRESLGGDPSSVQPSASAPLSLSTFLRLRVCLALSSPLRFITSFSISPDFPASLSFSVILRAPLFVCLSLPFVSTPYLFLHLSVSLFLFLCVSLSVSFLFSFSFSLCPSLLVPLSLSLSWHSFLSLSASPSRFSLSSSLLPPHLPALTVIASKNCSLHEWVPITKAKFVFLMSLSTVFWG